VSVPKWAWSGSCEQFLHCGLRKFRHSKSSVDRWYTQLDRRRFVYDTYKTMKATRTRHGWVHMFTTHRPNLTIQLYNFDFFRTCRTALLRGNWQDFNWHDASRGPSVIAELLVFCTVVMWSFVVANVRLKLKSGARNLTEGRIAAAYGPLYRVRHLTHDLLAPRVHKRHLGGFDRFCSVSRWAQYTYTQVAEGAKFAAIGCRIYAMHAHPAEELVVVMSDWLKARRALAVVD